MAYSTSASDRLAAVRAAIDAILSGAQEYYVGSRRVRRADLRDLYKMEKELQAAVTREANGGIFRVTEIHRPT